MKGKIFGVGLIFIGIHLIVQYSGLFFFALFESAGFLQEIFGKYLSFYFYAIEMLLISFTPLVFVGILLKYPPKNNRAIWQYYTWQFLLTHFCFFFGLVAGVFFWKPPNDFLPDEGVAQPFSYYWTGIACAVTAAVGVVYLHYWHKRQQSDEINAIGSKED